MAEIIDFAEIQAARRKARARIPERENLERAVQLMRENLAAVGAELADAPTGALRDIGICRTALADFAWHCAKHCAWDCAGFAGDRGTGRATPDGAFPHRSHRGAVERA